MNNIYYNNIITFLGRKNEDILTFYDQNDNSNYISFYQNGNITINGNIEKALSYIINACLDYYFDPGDYCSKTMRIGDFTFYIEINLNTLSISSDLPPSKELDQFKQTIEKQVFKVIKMKAFI